MARIKSDTPPLPEPPPARKFRPKAWFSIVILAALGVGAHFLWRNTAATISHSPQYVLTAENIHLTPPPAWIRTDIKSKALRDANLVGSLSLLDNWDELARRVKEAFEFQPWIASVERITRQLPRSLNVEVTYRKPVAAVESSDENGVMYLPIDEHAIRLPEGDLTEAERRYLPRISNITGRPLVGDRWNDDRVLGGAKLAMNLADVWKTLQLVEIIATQQASSESPKNSFRYELVTTGGTRIVWGTTPGDEIAGGESPFPEKRQRLLEYATQHGKLESIDGPAVLDVRSELVVTPRTARHKRPVPKDEATQTK